MNLDYFDLDGERPPFFSNKTISGCIQDRDMMFGFRVGFWSADLMVQLSNFKNPRWRLTAILDIQKWP